MNMFSDILKNIQMNESSSNASHEFSQLINLTKQSYLEYEEAKIQSEEKNKEIVQNEEYLSTIEKERGKIISELAIKMQTKQDLKNRVEDLKNTMQTLEFNLKKYNKMKLSSVDLETFTRVKKIFGTYKSMLKIYFDYSNGANTAVHKGYMFNRITKNLTYFEFNSNEKSVDEITEYLWNKIKSVSDKKWEH